MVLSFIAELHEKALSNLNKKQKQKYVIYFKL